MIAASPTTEAGQAKPHCYCSAKELYRVPSGFLFFASTLGSYPSSSSSTRSVRICRCQTTCRGLRPATPDLGVDYTPLLLPGRNNDPKPSTMIRALILENLPHSCRARKIRNDMRHLRPNIRDLRTETCVPSRSAQHRGRVLLVRRLAPREA